MLCSTYHSTGLKFLVQSDCKAHKLYHTLGTQALPNTNTWNTYCKEFSVSAHLLNQTLRANSCCIKDINSRKTCLLFQVFSTHTRSQLFARKVLKLNPVSSLFVTVLMKIDTFDPLAQRNKSKLWPNLAILLGIYALFGVLLHA